MKISNNQNNENNQNQQSSNHKVPKIPSAPRFASKTDAENPTPNPGGPKKPNRGPLKPWYKRIWVWVVALIVVVVGWMFLGHGSQKQTTTPKKATTSQSSSSMSASSASSSSTSYKLPSFKQKKKNTVDMKPIIEKFFTAYQVQPNSKSMDYDKRMKLMGEYSDKSVVSTLIPESTITEYKHQKKPQIVQSKLRKPIEISPVDGEQTGTYMVNISYQNYTNGSDFTHDQTDKYAVNTDHDKIVSVQLLKSTLDN